MLDKLKLAGRSRPAFLLSQFRLHPAIRIVVFIVMSIFITHLGFKQLLIFCLVLAFGLGCCLEHRFMIMMKRMRWLFLSIVFIYAYSTPGRYLSNWPLEFSPTYEGIQQGLNQILRISLVIAGIAILMASSTREVLMVGMYCLLRPLKLLNLSAERFTARLYLTLHYMDRAQTEINVSKKITKWHQMLHEKLNKDDGVMSQEIIALNIPRLSISDALCMALLLILSGLCL